MNTKLLIGSALILLGAIVTVTFVKSRGPTPAPVEEETPPTVVTVQTSVLKRVTFHRYVQGYGTIEAAPATDKHPAAAAQVAAPAAGVVARVNVVEGQRVEKGDVMVELNSGTTTIENARRQVSRQKELYAQRNTSLRSLEEAEAQLDLLRITAPLSGTVARVNVKAGQAVDSSTAVAEVIDLDRLAVSASVPATEANALQPGQGVELLTRPPVMAKLTFVSPTVDQSNDTVLARALLPGNSGLRPGQFVSVRIVTAAHTNRLAAPDESVVTDAEGKRVIALITGDEATQTPVQTGLHEDGWIEVEAPGLKVGDAVVTLGAYGLPEKTKIRVQTSAGGNMSGNSSSAQ